MKRAMVRLNSEQLVAILNACFADSFDTLVDSWVDAPVIDTEDRGVFDMCDAIRDYDYNNTTRTELENDCKYVLYSKVFKAAEDYDYYSIRALDVIRACDNAVDAFVNIIW